MLDGIAAPTGVHREADLTGRKKRRNENPEVSDVAEKSKCQTKHAT